MPTMTCPRCGGELEWEMEPADSGQAGYVVSRACTPAGQIAGGWHGIQPDVYSHGQTTCDCIWTLRELDALDQQASRLANEWTPREP